jgi:hypothetical protein
MKPFLLLGPSAALGVDFLADFAFLLELVRLHYKFHTARFTGAVLMIAMLSEMAPFPISAGETVLIEKTHLLRSSVHHFAHAPP